MSETDSFIEEVAEEVRRDRLFKLFRRYGWIAGLAIVAIVGGAAWNEYSKAEAERAAQNLGDNILAAVALENAEARAGALAEIGADGDGAVVLALVQAAAEADAGNSTAADATLAALANDTSVPEVYRALASLKRLYLNDSGLAPADRTAIIETLSVPGSPFRPLALEQRALTLVNVGDTEGAIALFTEIMTDSESTAQVVSRARQMILVLGGSLETG